MSQSFREVELGMKLIKKRYNSLLKQERKRVELLEKVPSDKPISADDILKDIRKELNKIELRYK